MSLRLYFFTITVIILFGGACRPVEVDGFRIVMTEKHGIDFVNQLTPDDTFNIINFRYFYNGGGVGIGDFNGDSLPDIYLGGNMVSGEMYLNRGDFRFQDITDVSGTVTDRWVTGVSVVDINQDQLLDLYLGVSGPHNAKRSNLLYINQGNNAEGIPEFREMAADYGLAFDGFTTHAAFLDYDRDNDLDVYLLNAANTEFYGNTIRKTRNDGKALTNDKFFENIGVGKNGHPVFQDISLKAGIVKEGFGLGINVHDFNGDFYPDIYVSNDYLSNDLLYINQRDGTFRDEADHYFDHLSYFSMGNDVGDINNDGLEDVITLDMLPAHREGQQMMVQPMNEDRYRMAMKKGYLPQYMRNTLQLRRTNDTEDMPVFSEIGQLAGVHHTDWSWAPLLADFDNDGWKDLFVTNGYVKDITNADFVAFDMNEAFQIFNPQERDHRIREIYEALPAMRRSNYLFRNEKNLQFENMAESWGLDYPSFSQGAAYADFDQDGDLDLLVNNLNAPPFLYENLSEQHHYLQFYFDQPYHFLNSSVEIIHHNKKQVQTFTPYRGYQSSVEPLLHFGLGKDTLVQEIRITNPKGLIKIYNDVSANQRIIIRDEGFHEKNHPPSKPVPYFRRVAQALALPPGQVQHTNTLKSEPLTPYRYDQRGPALACEDFNQDGWEDFFVGGTYERQPIFFYQQADGSFLQDKLAHEIPQNVPANFLDIDQDGDLDLYLISSTGSEKVQGRLYLNAGLHENGTVIWQPKDDKLLVNGGPDALAVSADYDRDGDTDLFVGGHVQEGKYPLYSPSRLLRNDQGSFTDVSEYHLSLANLGIVNDAVWADINQDQWPDLIIASEWEPLRIFINHQGKLRNWSSSFSDLHGWWNTVEVADLDADGDKDILLGNLGLNHDFAVSDIFPLEVMVKDFDNNGQPDPILSAYLEDKDGDRQRFPLHSRHALSSQILNMKRRFPRYLDYAEATLEKVFTQDERSGAYKRNITITESLILENVGMDLQGLPIFETKPLPTEAQFAPIHDFLVTDVNQDQFPDIVCVGNLLSTRVEIGRMDALPGLVLLNQGGNQFMALSPEESGFSVDGEGRKLVQIKTPSGNDRIVVSQQNGELFMFEKNDNLSQLAQEISTSRQKPGVP
jgi:hypothetical protein